MVLSLILTIFAPVQPVSATSIPYAVDGRILTPDKTGDIVNWVEIAKFDGFSLIVRAKYINFYQAKGYYNNDAWQYSAFGPSNKYDSSAVRTRINNWFNGTASANGDNLSFAARLRLFTVSNNAMSVLGTASDAQGLSNGYSLPYIYKNGLGNDIAFALSYGESVNFLSNRYYTWQNGDKISNATAAKNYKKVDVPNNSSGMWLRSPGYSNGLPLTVGCLHDSSSADYGRAFQACTSDFGYIFPALWVDSRIFDPDMFTIAYNPNGGTGTINTYAVPVNTWHVISDQYYSRPGYKFDGFNTAPNGSGVQFQIGQSIYVPSNITLYAQWTGIPSYMAVYDPNGGVGPVLYDVTDSNQEVTISNKGFYRDGYTFDNYNTRSDGTGVIYVVGQKVRLTNHLFLYAQWKRDTPVQRAISYHPNGGAGSINTTYANDGSLFTVTAQNYVNPG